MLYIFLLKHSLHSLPWNHIRPQNVYTRRFPTAAVYNLMRERREALLGLRPAVSIGQIKDIWLAITQLSWEQRI